VLDRRSGSPRGVSTSQAPLRVRQRHMLLRSAEMDPGVMGPRDAIRFTAVRHVSASYHTGAIRSR